jgi:hypothetical protein
MKKWLFGLLSLIMVGSSIAIAMPNFSDYVCEDGNVEVTAPKTEDKDHNIGADDFDKENNDDQEEPDADNPSEAEEVTTYEFKTYKDYFIDNDVSKDTITANDLTGKGTEADPYIINSTKGFWYLTTLSLTAKYVELNSNVVLNDETFDENGNPSGGDGVVYNWDNIKAEKINFQGNGHDINGLYYKAPTTSYLGLFNGSNVVLNYFQMKNVYIEGKEFISPTCFRAKSATNIKTFGTVKGKHSSGVVNGAFYIDNCDNYVNLFGTDSSSGIATAVYEKISNCNNYGNITINNNNASGILNSGSTSYPNLIIENCKNYGKIIGLGGSNYGFAGIICWANINGLVIKNCINYGEIYNKLSTGSSTGMAGIAGIVYNKVSLINCENYGYIHQANPWVYNIGEMIGETGDWRNVRNTCVTITSCKAVSRSGLPIMGNPTEVKMLCKVIVKDFYLDHTSAKSISSGSGIIACVANDNIYIEDMYYKDYTDRWRTLTLFGNAYEQQSNINIKNLIIDCRSKAYMHYKDLYKLSTFNIDGFLYISRYDNTLTKYYDGTDFSGYVYNHKTGEYLLKATQSVGGFMTEVSENWLVEQKSFKKYP